MGLTLDECREILDNAHTDGALIVTEPNRIYLSGYASTQAAIAITKEGVFYFTDKRYLHEAREKIPAYMRIGEGSIAQAAELLRPCRRIGIEFELSHSLFNFAAAKTGKRGIFSRALRDISPVLKDMRAVKSESELCHIRKAQSITDDAFAKLKPFIKEGVSEIELAARLEYIMQSQGAALAFDTIMAFGENSAVPHAHRSERKLKDGDMIVMDFGAKWQGYCSDMTRTLAFGSISGRRAQIYDLVLQANVKAISRLKAGVVGANVQDEIRKLFADAGVSEHFTHSLGHGVGIDIHESPNYNARLLRENSVITVEPGLYFDGDFGVRIEDMVKIEQDGAENLTKSNKSLIIIGKN